MLQRFSVKNFKNFKNDFVWDLSSGKYNFNSESIKNGIVKNSVLYGKNGSGKSNLTYAVMDITTHLTDFTKQEKHYNQYINLDSEDDFATFSYEFKFEEDRVVYRYKKKNMTEVFDEEVYINDNCIIFEDFQAGRREVQLVGAENLNTKTRDLSLSFVKYIFNNTNLELSDETNCIFLKFKEFVEGMLFFGSGTSEGNFYQGFKSSQGYIASAIVDAGKLEELEHFLHEFDINYSLERGEDSEGNSVIMVRFKNRTVNIYSVASHGTKVIMVFFYWMIQLSDITFLVVDEFDAYYHNEVSETILKKIRNGEVQSVFTTHNTTIMSNDLLRPDCYFIVQNNQIKELSSLTVKELRMAHNLEKMYNAGAFDE